MSAKFSVQILAAKYVRAFSRRGIGLFYLNSQQCRACGMMPKVDWFAKAQQFLLGDSIPISDQLWPAWSCANHSLIAEAFQATQREDNLIGFGNRPLPIYR